MDYLLASPEKYLTKDKSYYIMCQSGRRSSVTVEALKKQGYDVINVAGGMGSYAGPS
jgi:rhodanese-related sulfurtransferase